MCPATPSPSPIQEANLERWKSTREPATWVWKHVRGWSHKDWLALLAELRESAYWPMREAAVGQHLEMLRTKLEPISQDYASSYQTHLHKAAGRGRSDQVELLLAVGLDVNAQGSTRKQTALHEAVERGSKEVAALLVAAKADLNIKDHIGETALYKAVDQGHRDIVELLLAAKADANAEGGGETALHRAVDKDRKGIVELLLTNKADVNSKNASDETPLHLAIRRGHKDIAKLLRRHGARIGIWKRLALVDWQSFNEILIQILIVLLVGGVVGRLLHWLAHSFPIWGGSVLGIVAALCAAFCVLVVTDNDDEGLAVYATRLLSGWAMFAVGIALLLHWQSPWFPTWAAAATFGAVAAPILCPLALLLPAPLPSREQVNAQDHLGRTPLMCAAEKGDVRRVKALIARGADVNAQGGSRRRTALMEAAEKGSSGCLRALVVAGADVNARDHVGKTAIARYGYKPEVAAILKSESSAAAAPIKPGMKSGQPICDQCGGQIQGNDGYAFYSGVMMGFRKEEAIPIGNLFVCASCTNHILSDKSFRAASSHSGQIESKPGMLPALNAESIVKRCKKLGLTADQARVIARKLALTFLEDPAYGATLTLQFWTSGAKLVPVTGDTPQAKDRELCHIFLVWSHPEQHDPRQLASAVEFAVPGYLSLPKTADGKVAFDWITDPVDGYDLISSAIEAFGQEITDASAYELEERRFSSSKGRGRCLVAYRKMRRR